MLAQFTAWLQKLFEDTFGALWTLITDFFVWALDGILGTFAAIVAAIPIPSFMAEGLGGMMGQLPAGVLWGITTAGLPQCLAIIGAGYAFRLTRKLLTLGQW